MAIPISAALNAYTKAAEAVAGAPGGKAAASAPTGGSFGEVLQGVVDDLMSTGKASEQQTVAAISNKADVVDVVTAVAEAEATLEMVVSVRDRVVAAYQDILRMPI